MQDYSYHCHSTYSDGSDSVEKMLDQAVKCGLKEIGFSDHLSVNKNFTLSPSWQKVQSFKASEVYRTDFMEAQKLFIDYVMHVRKAASNYPLKVYVGAEVDFFTYEGWEQEFRAFQKSVKLDYYISGNHFLVDDNNIPFIPSDLSRLFSDPKEQQAIISRHFQTIIQSIESGLFDFVAHIDYMRQAPICGTNDFRAEKINVIEALSRTQTPAELSTKGLRKAAEMFPTFWMLQEMQRQNVPVIISDDAHCCQDLRENFDIAEAELTKLNYTNRWKL